MTPRRITSANLSVSGITPFLWFSGKVEEAVGLYTSLFARSKITHVTRSGPDGPAKPGEVFMIEFRLAGTPFIGMGIPRPFDFTEAFSLQVGCKTQAQVDRLWTALGRGGKPGQCGWLKDRFGVSWQIVPDRLGELMTDRDPEKVRRVFGAMMKMGKIEIAGLERAARGT